MAHRLLDELDQLIPEFCTLAFDQPAALGRWLGAPLSAGTAEPRFKSPRLTADWLQVERHDLAFSDAFLTTLNLNYERPQSVCLADLERSLGACRALRSSARGGPTYYTFQVLNQPLMAVIRVTAEASDHRGQLKFRQVSLRRLPPDPQVLEDRRAFRLAVLADFRATEDIGDRVPLPTVLRAPGDLAELIARWQPAVVLNVPRCLDPDDNTLSVHFALSSLDDLHIDRLMLAFPAASAVLKLRRSAMDLACGRISRDQFQNDLPQRDLPRCWLSRARDFANQPSFDRPRLCDDIDQALSSQCEAVLRDESFQRFMGCWLGLAYLVEHFDFSQGSRIDVFSASSEHLADVMQRGFVAPERHHRGGPPPAAVLVDRGTAPVSAEDLERWSQLADQVSVPVFVDLGPGRDDPIVQARGSAPAAGYLAGVTQQICLRHGLTSSSSRRFVYRPTGTIEQTACWGSGIWGWGALLANSLAEFGRADLDAAATDPPSGCGDHSMCLREQAAAEPHFSTCKLDHDAGADRIIARQARGVLEPQTPEDSLDAKLILTPMLHYAERWRHQYEHRLDGPAAAKSLESALRARFPEVHVRVFQQGASPTALTVHLSPRYTLRSRQQDFLMTVPFAERSPLP